MKENYLLLSHQTTIMKTVSYKYDRVLLIDDDGIDNFINERIITTSFFAKEVVVKSTVKDALSYLEDAKGDASVLPSIIFLDLNMPVAGGFEFMDEFEKLVNANPSMQKNCKVIVLSSSVSPDDINRVSLNRLIYKYINKPLSDTYLNAINL